MENEPLVKPKKRPKTKRGKVEDEIVPLVNVRCKQRLGGLLKSYSRKAA
jgi:putative transposase